MRVGLVTWWFNRGQATVMRTIRHALDQLGHETFVLARPTAETFDRPSYVADDATWTRDGVTVAANAAITPEAYVAWAREHDLDAVATFQNLEFEGLAALRDIGVRTIGTYMWEGLDPADAVTAAETVDHVFAMNEPSRAHFSGLGMSDVGLVRFAAHPEVAARRRPPALRTGARYVYMGGYLRQRKPLGAVVEAFRRGAPADATLTVKTQTPIHEGHLARPTESREINALRTEGADRPVDLTDVDPRIRVVVDDLGLDDFLDGLTDHHVIVGVSRWEGLGLHLHEAEALGRVLLLNRMEPYLAHVADGGVATLCDSKVIGRRKQGIEIHEPDVDSLAAGFARLGNPTDLVELTASIVPHAVRWDRFVADVDREIR